ncbi:YqaA family protein [Nanoarchaeota archaeon]
MKKRKVVEKIIENPRNIRIIEVISVIIFLIFMGIFVYVLFNYRQLEVTIKESIGTYGYLALFLSSFLTDLLGQPLSPDVALITGILLGFNIFIVIMIISFGSYLASLMSYSLGITYGEKAVKVIFGFEKYSKWKNFFRRFDKIALALAAMTPVPYVLMCWISGIFRVRIRDFLLFALIPRTIRYIIIAYVIVVVKGIVVF